MFMLISYLNQMRLYKLQFLELGTKPKILKRLQNNHEERRTRQLKVQFSQNDCSYKNFEEKKEGTKKLKKMNSNKR